MKLFGKRKNERGVRYPERNTEPRKRRTPTKAERKLAKRIESYQLAIQRLGSGKLGPDKRGYRRPGSLQLA